MRALYITYDGLLDPLGQSQITPYLKKLSNLYTGNGKKNLLKFTILSFEKPARLKDKNHLKRVEEELNRSGINWVRLKYHKHPSSLATAYDILSGIVVSLFVLKKEKINIVHTRSFVPVLIGYIFKKVFRVKFIFDMRGLYPEERVEGSLWKSGGILYNIAKFLEKKFLLNADIIVVLTQKAKEIIKKFDYLKGLKPDIRVIPTCVDLEKFNFRNLISTPSTIKNLNGKFVFIYSGSIGTWYLLEEMIRFFRYVISKIKDAHFVILTQHKKNLAIIKEALSKQNISDQNFTIKCVDYCDVPQWLSIADVSIFFIKPVYSKKASCPTKMGESLAAGLPLIVNSGIGDCDEIIKKEKVGVIIGDFSEESFLKSIDELKDMLKENKNALRNRCRKVAENIFSLDRGVSSYFDIYNKVGS